MFATTKKMVGIAALIAAGLVAADDFAMGRVASPAEVTKQAARHPAMIGTPSARVARAMQTVDVAGQAAPSGQKTDRLSAAEPAAACSEQTWPRIAPECLLSVNATARKAIRTITVERQTGVASSVLERTPAL